MSAIADYLLKARCGVTNALECAGRAEDAARIEAATSEADMLSAICAAMGVPMAVVDHVALTWARAGRLRRAVDATHRAPPAFAEAVDKYGRAMWDFAAGYRDASDEYEAVVAAHGDIVRNAVEAEREACAQNAASEGIVRFGEVGPAKMAENIAAIIRARGAK